MSVSASLQFINEALKELLASAIVSTGDGILLGAEVGLFQSWPGFSTGLAIGDITIADYTGYAAKAITTFSSPYIGSDNNPAIQVAAPVLSFTPSGTTVTNTIIGAMLTTPSAADLLAIGAFDEPVQMASTDDYLQLLVEIFFPAGSNFAQAVGEN